MKPVASALPCTVQPVGLLHEDSWNIPLLRSPSCTFVLAVQIAWGLFQPNLQGFGALVQPAFALQTVLRRIPAVQRAMRRFHPVPQTHKGAVDRGVDVVVGLMFRFPSCAAAVIGIAISAPERILPIRSRRNASRGPEGQRVDQRSIGQWPSTAVPRPRQYRGRHRQCSGSV